MKTSMEHITSSELPPLDPMFLKLKAHIGHKVACVSYGDDDVAIECEDCMEVLYSTDSEGEYV